MQWTGTDDDAVNIDHRPRLPELASPTALSDALLLPSGTL